MGCEKARVFVPDQTLKTKPEGEIKLAFFAGFRLTIGILFSPRVSFQPYKVRSEQNPEA